MIELLFFFNAFIIVWAMFGYGSIVKIIGKRARKQNKLINSYPTVTVMIVAHNEENVIKEKLENVLKLNYPKEKIKFLVASDHSTDSTNNIVNKFIIDHPNEVISLYVTQEHKGKTNAQNEAQRLVDTEFLVMTDANAMFDTEAVKELVSSFVSYDIAYVTGRLQYVNNLDSDISNMENQYWNNDIAIRAAESKIQTITAGNGALYACRNEDYYHFDPILCHDSSMPIHYALNFKRAIFNPDAVAYERAGNIVEDEFKRKVRMNRQILKDILPDIRVLNVFKYKWFSFFYFGHRTCRYLLWLAHLIVLISNICLQRKSTIYKVAIVFQSAFYFTALLRLIFRFKNSILSLPYYYCMTILAQWVGVINMLTGKAKPVWEKAESTRVR